jgi:hypothetical protein
MVEQPSPTQGSAGGDADLEVGPSPSADFGGPPGRKPRWLVAKRRPPWWEVPPQGYLEVESRNSPTSPRMLRRLARAAVKAGLSWHPGSPLPVQRYVEAQERARLVFQARRELPKLTAVASQVMLVDTRLTEAEEVLRQASRHRSSLAGGHTTARQQPSGNAPALPQPARSQVLDPWSEAIILVTIASGQAVLAYAEASDAGLGAVALGLLAVAAAVSSIVAAQLAARGLHRLGAAPEGSDDPRRRRRLDVAVACGGLACGVTLAIAIGQLAGGTGPAALGLALLGLATAVSYAATPGGTGRTNASRWRSVTSWVWRQQQERRSRRRRQAARANEAAAHATVRRLREELAVLAPQLFAAEQSALLFWRYQVAIGDAAQHGFEQHLAAYSMRRSRGVWRPITDWWRGASPAPPGSHEGFISVGQEQTDWREQVARITTAATRVLVRRGLLDITHGLRRASPPGASPLDHNGSQRASHLAPTVGDGHRRAIDVSGAEKDQPADQR